MSGFLQRNHEPTLLAKRVTETWDSHEELIDLAKKLESLGFYESISKKNSSLSVRARYPAFNNEGNLIDLPDHVFDSDEADEASNLALRIFEICDLLLRREGCRLKAMKQTTNNECKLVASDYIQLLWSDLHSTCIESTILTRFLFYV